MIRRATVSAMAVFFCVSCGKKEEKPTTTPSASASAAMTAAPSAAAKPETTPAVVAAGSPPADGKYERVIVDGVTVPMIQVMEKGTIVLVDTDGKKPRTWEEQYKRKRELPVGQFDLHKTDVNKNDKFDDDPIDKEGLWVIDPKGNITKH